MIETILIIGLTLLITLSFIKYSFHKRFIKRDLKGVEWKVKLTSGEKYFVKHFGSDKYPGMNNLVGGIECRVLNEVENYNLEAFEHNARIALDLLQGRHPLLQVGLVRERGLVYDEWYFVKRKAQQKLSLTVTWDDPQEVVKREMNHNFDMNGPFLRMVVCRDRNDDRKYYVVFCFHHVVSDGFSCLSIFQQFYQILDNLDFSDALSEKNIMKINIIKKKIPPREIPKSIEDQVSHNMILSFMGQLWFSMKIVWSLLYHCNFRPRIYFSPAPITPEIRTSDIKVLSLSEQDTVSLIKLCKERQVTVTNLVHAALVNVTDKLYRERTKEKTSTTVPIAISTDLRRIPPINSGLEDIRFMSSVMTTFVKPSQDVWKVCKDSLQEIKDQLHADYLFKFYQTQLLASKLPTEKTYRIPFVLSNMGLLNKDAWNTKQLDLNLKVGSISTQGVSNQIGIVSFTTNNKLSLCFNYNNSLDQDQVKTLIKDLEHFLTDISRNASSA